jgi:predicted Zn-dependent protease
MKNRSLRLTALLLMFLLTAPNAQLIAFAQEGSGAQEQKPQVESPEEKKLREREETQRKRDEDRKNKEAKARASEAKKYQSLNEFAEDLYASDYEFREQVDYEYLKLQSSHADEAYGINISTKREVLRTENEGEFLKLRRVLYDNPRVQEYVNRLGQQLVPEDSDKLYSFKVIQGPIPHAYTLSTGTVLISAGMISLLDNEAQLAYVLAHELAHVYKNHWRIKVMMPLAQSEYNKKQERKRAFLTGVLALAGAGMGAAIAGKEGAIIGAFSGYETGKVVGNYYARSIGLDWDVAQENEADDFALKATLGKSFDIQEVPRLYATLAQASRLDNRMQLGFLGARSRIKDRNEHTQKLITGVLQPQLQDALKANKLKGTSPEFNLITAELKRDNGIQAFYFDMFQMAKTNLQQSVTLRSDDPLAAYYYGRVMKQIGRTKEELDLAQQSLLKAISLDTRNEIPDVQLHRALMLMDSKESANQSEAIAALKAYITNYERRRATTIINERDLPSNVDILYGYMRLLGDKTWIAPSAADLARTRAVNPGSSITPAPAAIPKVEPASLKLTPTSSKKTRKP